MSVVALIETGETLKSYPVSDLPLTFEIPATRSKIKGNVLVRDDLAKDVYLLARIIRNDWGEIEAGFYKYERTER